MNSSLGSPFISGFTLVRNGVEFGYPFLESFQSLLALCDELVINVGISTDETKAFIEKWKSSLPPAESTKIKIFESEWPFHLPEMRRGGQILSQQTNLALEKCKGRWCFYLQADEVLHEEDIPQIRKELEKLDGDPRIDALVLNYVHFYGSYDVVQSSRSSYRREIRAIRNHRGIRSVGDAQGFRTGENNQEKIPSALSRARVFHYGWVRPPQIMKVKTGFMDTLYHSEASATLPATGKNYEYKKIIGLKPYKKSHPKVMKDRIQVAPPFDWSQAPRVFELKDCWKLVSDGIESLTGIRLFEYRNYRILRRC